MTEMKKSTGSILKNYYIAELIDAGHGKTNILSDKEIFKIFCPIFKNFKEKATNTLLYKNFFKNQ